jgi:hypothetical protein
MHFYYNSVNFVVTISISVTVLTKLKKQRVHIYKCFLELSTICLYSTYILLSSLLLKDRRGRDRMVVWRLQLPVQPVPITTDIVSSNPVQGDVYNIM